MTKLRKIYKIIDKLETDIKNMKLEARDCELATQLATHCLDKSSCMRTAMCYMSSMFLQLIKTQPVMNYLLYYTIDKIQSTHWINNIRTVKSMVNKDSVSRQTEVPTLFTALIRKTQNIRKSGKQGYKTPVHSRLPFTIWSFF